MDIAPGIHRHINDEVWTFLDIGNRKAGFPHQIQIETYYLAAVFTMLQHTDDLIFTQAHGNGIIQIGRCHQHTFFGQGIQLHTVHHVDKALVVHQNAFCLFESEFLGSPGLDLRV